MKSQPYKAFGKLFRYNFTTCTVEYIQKADEDEVKINEEWKGTHGGRSLFSIDSDGYITLETIGLNRENWERKDVRDCYLSAWCKDLDDELEAMTENFVRYELPYLV